MDALPYDIIELIAKHLSYDEAAVYLCNKSLMGSHTAEEMRPLFVPILLKIYSYVYNWDTCLDVLTEIVGYTCEYSLEYCIFDILDNYQSPVETCDAIYKGLTTKKHHMTMLSCILSHSILSDDLHFFTLYKDICNCKYVNTYLQRHGMRCDKSNKHKTSVQSLQTIHNITTDTSRCSLDMLLAYYIELYPNIVEYIISNKLWYLVEYLIYRLQINVTIADNLANSFVISAINGRRNRILSI
jgi:hypothetical protein